MLSAVCDQIMLDRVYGTEDLSSPTNAASAFDAICFASSANTSIPLCVEQLPGWPVYNWKRSAAARGFKSAGVGLAWANTGRYRSEAKMENKIV